MIKKRIVYENHEYKIKNIENIENIGSLIPALEVFVDFMSIIELILIEYEEYKINGLENLNIEIDYNEKFENIKFNLNFRYFEIRLVKYQEDKKSVNIFQSDLPKNIILDKDYTIFYKDGKLEGSFIKNILKMTKDYYSIEYVGGSYKDYVALIEMYNE